MIETLYGWLIGIYDNFWIISPYITMGALALFVAGAFVLFGLRGKGVFDLPDYETKEYEPVDTGGQAPPIWVKKEKEK